MSIFDNSVLGIKQESLEVVAITSGLDMQKAINTKYTVVSVIYCLNKTKGNVVVLDLENKIYNNTIAINEIDVDIGDILFVLYTY